MSTEFAPKFDLASKVVLVTGASRGIGRACALACAGSGADMIVGVLGKADGADLTAEIERIGRRALAVQMDLTDLATVRAAVAEEQAAFGRIDVLVNNVGLGPENLAEDVTEEDFDLTVNVNLKGHVLHHPGGGKADDRPEIRAHHQYQLAGRHGNAEG
jgi:NAD(P)-dependent dehydrogenase (short-subunit alcohol dehydrogenase family)